MPLDSSTYVDQPTFTQADSASFTLLCFSHLRWDFVHQRPQHLMTRFARTGPVVFWEEPIIEESCRTAELRVRSAGDASNVTIVTPALSPRLTGARQEQALRRLLDAYLASVPGPIVKWYYTPMMLGFSRHADAEAVVYDCMDELSAFRFAPPELVELERELLDAADVVFTGGYSLFEAKRDRHSNIHPFPSSIDPAHFLKARQDVADPEDQRELPRPRLGFYGVIDERFDIELLGKLADLRPDWQLVMVGPVVKIDPAELPRRPNIHYLGSKNYADLPAYLAGWDVALMLFAINESTLFISPTKTPEYLCAGKPVVSTPIRDVERHFGAIEGVKIASGAEAFARACDEALKLSRAGGNWLAESDLHLADLSWDKTQARMAALIAAAIDANQADPAAVNIVESELECTTI